MAAARGLRPLGVANGSGPPVRNTTSTSALRRRSLRKLTKVPLADVDRARAALDSHLAKAGVAVRTSGQAATKLTSRRFVASAIASPLGRSLRQVDTEKARHADLHPRAGGGQRLFLDLAVGDGHADAGARIAHELMM